VELDISGLGIIFYSPAHAAHIGEGEDYLTSSYATDEDVQRHVQSGTIVGFATGTSGQFILNFISGGPPDEAVMKADFKLRLGLHCTGGMVCVRDLYDLLDWEPECPEEQVIRLEDGFYRLTLCSDTPASGVLGDGQEIDVYLESWERLPDLARQGIPTLCE